MARAWNFIYSKERYSTGCCGKSHTLPYPWLYTTAIVVIQALLSHIFQHYDTKKGWDLAAPNSNTIPTLRARHIQFSHTFITRFIALGSSSDIVSNGYLDGDCIGWNLKSVFCLLSKSTLFNYKNSVNLHGAL